MKIFLLSLACMLGLCSADARAAEYFPVGVKEGQIPQFSATWYGGQLKAMQEPSLFQPAKDSPLPEIRFLWLRSFDKSIAVRAYMARTGPRLRAVRLSMPKTSTPGAIEWAEDIALSDRQWKTMVAYLRQPGAQFPYQGLTQEQSEMTFGTDGARWILESTLGGTYHIADVWSPTFADELKNRKEYRDIDLPTFKPFVKCCLYLLKIAGIKDEEIY